MPIQGRRRYRYVLPRSTKFAAVRRCLRKHCVAAPASRWRAALLSGLIGKCLALTAIAGLAAATVDLSNRFAFDASMDAMTPKGASADVSLTFSPYSTFDQSGLRLRLTQSFSQGMSWTDLNRVLDTGASDTRTDILVGYGQAFNGGFAMVAGGMSFGNSNVEFRQGVAQSNRSQQGATGLVSLYLTPSPKTMIFAQGRYSTVFDSYHVLAKAGYSVRPALYVGPEVAFLGGEGYSQWRVGAHLSGIDLGFGRLGFSAGYVSDENQGAGMYGGLNFSAHF